VAGQSHQIPLKSGLLLPPSGTLPKNSEGTQFKILMWNLNCPHLCKFSNEPELSSEQQRRKVFKLRKQPLHSIREVPVCLRQHARHIVSSSQADWWWVYLLQSQENIGTQLRGYNAVQYGGQSTLLIFPHIIS
jgi:hypothetical protein